MNGFYCDLQQDAWQLDRATILYHLEGMIHEIRNNLLVLQQDSNRSIVAVVNPEEEFYCGVALIILFGSPPC